MSSSESNSSESSTRSPFGRKLALGAILIVVFIVLAPAIIANTPLRDWLINAAISDESFQVSTQTASLGYLSPLAVQGFRLQALDGSMQFDVEEMESEKSWLTMLFSADDLGTFRFRDPVVRIVTGIAADETDESEEDSEAVPSEPVKTLPTLAAHISGAGVQVRSAGQQEPALDLQGLDFAIRVEQDEHGSVVNMDPTTILDEETLTPELCSQGVQLIAPMLADVVDVEGKISFRIDQFSVPVGGGEEDQSQQRAEIGGTIKLADVSVSLNNNITGQLVPLLRQFGAIDRNMSMTVGQSLEVAFRVVDGRVHHQGLMFMLPISGSSFEIESSGSVGFDETLDLYLALGFPKTVRGNNLLTRFLTHEPLVVHVTGTVDQPKIGLEPTGGWEGRLGGVLDSLGSRARSAGDPTGAGDDPKRSKVRDAAGAVLGIVDGLLD